MKVRLWVMINLLALFFFTSCQSSQTIDLSAEEIVDRAVQQMRSLEGFEYLIDRSGEPVFLDYDEVIAFRRAQGTYNADGRGSAQVRIIAPGLVVEVELISLPEEQWETNYLTGEWQISDPRYSFKPSFLFDPDTGIPAIIEQDLSELQLLGYEELEELPGKKLYALTGVLDGERPYQITFGMIDNENLAIKFWVDPQTFDVHRISMTDPINPGDEEPTIWLIDFWHFGKTFDIQPPILAGQD